MPLTFVTYKLILLIPLFLNNTKLNKHSLHAELLKCHFKGSVTAVQ